MITLSAAAIIAAFAFALGLIIGTYRKNKKRFEATLSVEPRNTGITPKDRVFLEDWYNQYKTQNSNSAI